MGDDVRDHCWWRVERYSNPPFFCGGSFGDDDLLRECISNKQVTHAYSMFVLQQSIYYSLQDRG